MKKITFFIALQLLFISLLGQDLAADDIIQVGIQMPDHQFAETINSPIDNIRISDYHGKLLILDVWNKGCASCVRLFPHMQQLQEKYGDKLQIVLVNTQTKLSKDSKENILHVLEKVKDRIGKPITLPIVLNDEEFDRFVPVNGVPYEVWINPDGKVIGLTGARDVNEKNIDRLLNGDNVQFINVQYLPWKSSGSNAFPLNFKNGNILEGDSAVKFQCSIYQGRVGSILSILKTKNEDGECYGVTETFNTLLSLYKPSERKIFDKYPVQIIKVKDPFFADQLNFDWTANNSQEECDRHSFAYDIYSAKSFHGNEMDSLLRAAAERSFGKLYFKETTTNKPFMVVSTNKNISKLTTKGGEPINSIADEISVSRKMQNTPAREILYFVVKTFNMEVIDSVRSPLKIDFTLPSGFDSWSKDQKIAFLKSNGIELRQIIKTVPAVLITDEAPKKKASNITKGV